MQAALPLSPELVLVSPPELARAARAQLPDRPFFASSPAPVPAARRALSPVRRAAGLLALYAGVVAWSGTPLLLLGLAR